MADADSDVLSTPPHHEINTPRLRLRTLYVSDAAALLPMLQQAEVMRWMKSGRPLPSLSVAERWVKDRALGQDVFNFAIELRTTPDGDNIDAPAVIIGVMGSFHWPRVGYVVHADYAGNGYATEALAALVPALFSRMPSALPSPEALGYDYIEGLTDSQNLASQRVLQKSGFTYCGTSLQDFQHPVLGLRDTAIFRIARPGVTLEELGLVLPNDTDAKTQAVDEAFVPPIQ